MKRNTNRTFFFLEDCYQFKHIRMYFRNALVQAIIVTFACIVSSMFFLWYIPAWMWKVNILHPLVYKIVIPCPSLAFPNGQSSIIVIHPSVTLSTGRWAKAAAILICCWTSSLSLYSDKRPSCCTFLNKLWLKWKLHPVTLLSMNTASSAFRTAFSKSIFMAIGFRTWPLARKFLEILVNTCIYVSFLLSGNRMKTNGSLTYSLYTEISPWIMYSCWNCLQLALKVPSRNKGQSFFYFGWNRTFKFHSCIT